MLAFAAPILLFHSLTVSNFFYIILEIVVMRVEIADSQACSQSTPSSVCLPGVGLTFSGVIKWYLLSAVIKFRKATTC